VRLPLTKRRKSKKDQTLDTVASVAKAWGEWQLAKSAAKAARRTPWKIVGAVGAALAAGSLAAKKLLGGGGGEDGSATPPQTPAYTGPVPDPNAPSTSAGGQAPAPPRGPLTPGDQGPDQPIAGSGPVPDPDAPDGSGSDR